MFSPVLWAKYEQGFGFNDRFLFARRSPTFAKPATRLQHLYEIPARYWLIIFIYKKTNDKA